MPSELTPWALMSVAREVYAGAPMTLQQRLTTVYRPLYGIVHDILRRIPPGARQVDVGCGSGSLLLLADRLRHLAAGYGFDPKPASIRLAQAANRSAHLHFAVAREVPAGALAGCDLITVIDVMHHVPPAEQPALLAHLGHHARPGTRVILRDLDPRPRWSAWANRLTDYLSTGSRVTYVEREIMCERLERSGFAVQHASHSMHYVWSPYVITATRR